MRTLSSGCPGAHHGPLTRWSPARPRHTSLVAATFLISFIGIFVPAKVFPENSRPVVYVMSIERTIDPVVARFLTRGIAEANDAGASLLVIEWSGQGGGALSVDRVAGAIAESPVPVALYLLPRGPSVGSAALRLMGASRITAAATNLNAPVEVISADLPDLLKKLNGRLVTVGSRQLRVQTDGATIRRISMSGAADLLSGLLNPDNAYVLLILGIVGLLLEITTPGTGIPGLVGVGSLIASIAAFVLLSVNPVGLAVIVLGVVLFVADVKVASHGAIAVFGIAGILGGSFLLFHGAPGSATAGDIALRVSPITILMTTFVLSTILIFIVFKGVGAQRRRVVTGPDSLSGDGGTALEDFRPVDDRRDGLSLSGTVRVGGEEWSAVSMGETIRSGDEVIVVAAEGIHLVVVKRN